MRFGFSASDAARRMQLGLREGVETDLVRSDVCQWRWSKSDVLVS